MCVSVCACFTDEELKLQPVFFRGLVAHDRPAAHSNRSTKKHSPPLHHSPLPSAGVFVTGLQFGTPPQTLQLLIDTGSGVTHVAGRGCGSSCGVGLSPSAGFDAQGSSTAQRVPCDEQCSCPQCECQTQGVEEPYCVFRIAYGGRGGCVFRQCG